MEKGWVKLNRDIRESPLWDFEKPELVMAYIDLLLSANHKDAVVNFNGKFIEVKKGTFITSQVKLAERWGVQRKTVKNWLNKLKSIQAIDAESIQRSHTLITVKSMVPEVEGAEEYTSKYTTEYTTEYTTDYPQTRIKEYKNNKEEKKDICASVPSHLLEPIKEYIAMREELKKPLRTAEAVSRTIQRLIALSDNEEEQKKILYNSIDNRWTGFYPLKKEVARSEDNRRGEFANLDCEA